MPPRPHVSEAIVHLRSWVTAAAALVVVCLAVRLLVFGFVHYTECRWQELRPGTAAAAPLKVVQGAAVTAKADAVRRAGLSGTAVTRPTLEARVDANRVRSVADSRLRSLARVSGSAGTVALLALAGLCFLGSVVAAGGAVPGSAQAVKAAVWAAMLCVLALPWETAGASGPGALADYATLTSASDAVTAGRDPGLALLARFVALPLLLITAAVMVACWFHAGVQRGIIITAPSEMDELIEREVAAICKRGVAPGVPRALGALNRAIGDTTDRAGPAGVPAVLLHGGDDSRRPI